MGTALSSLKTWGRQSSQKQSAANDANTARPASSPSTAVSSPSATGEPTRRPIWEDPDLSPRVRGELFMAEAAKHEEAGRMEQAVACYKKAFKLCPELEDSLRPDEDDTLELAYTRMPNGSGCPDGVPRHRTFSADLLLRQPSSTAQLTSDQKGELREMWTFFQEEGYLVLDDALSAAEVETAKGHFKTFMECAGIDIEDKEEVGARFADPQVGIVGKSGAGHSAMNWYVRSRMKVKEAFRLALFGPTNDCDDSNGSDASQREKGKKLITSFDGFNYFRNPETDPSWQGSTTSWLHFDAGHKTHERYVQGLVNLIDCTAEQDAGIVLIPRSHKTCFPICVPQDPQHPSYITYMGPHEWKLVQEAKVEERPFRVPLKAGSLVLWKSSVMHCNSACLPRPKPSVASPSEPAGESEAQKEQPSDDTTSPASVYNPEQLIRRLAVYVCMCPDPQDRVLTADRRRYFSEGRTTCHQPDIMRGTGDHARSEFIKKGAVITSLEDLPEGAAELL